MKQWMSPEGWTTPEAAVDLRVGGPIHIVMQGTPIAHIGSRTTVSFQGIYTIIEQPHRLVFTWDWEDQRGTHVMVLFKALSVRRTEITLIHTGFTNDRSVKEDTYAWTSTFNHLERFLAERQDKHD